MNINILKRLQLAEKAVKDNNPTIPDMVFITYRESTDDFLVKEDFLKYDLKGKVTGKSKRKTTVVKKLHDYIVKPDFRGMIYLELFDLPESGNMYVLGEKELKQIRKHGGCFAVESVAAPEQGIKAEAAITILV